MFIFPCALLSYFSGYLDGFNYFASAGLIDCVVIWAVCSYAKTSKFADRIILISGLSLTMNLLGWVLYENYYPATIYVSSFHALYILAILALLRGDGVHDTTGDLRMGVFRLFDHKRDNLHSALCRQAEK